MEIVSRSRVGFVRLPKSAFAQLEVDCSSSSTRSKVLESTSRTDTLDPNLDMLGETGGVASLVWTRLAVDIASERTKSRYPRFYRSWLHPRRAATKKVTLGTCSTCSERHPYLDIWDDAPMGGDDAIRGAAGGQMNSRGYQKLCFVPEGHFNRG